MPLDDAVVVDIALFYLLGPNLLFCAGSDAVESLVKHPDFAAGAHVNAVDNKGCQRRLSWFLADPLAVNLEGKTPIETVRDLEAKEYLLTLGVLIAKKAAEHDGSWRVC